MTELHSHHRSRRRFYIFMTTVVVGALLLLMFINDNGILGLTGSSIGFEDTLEEITTKNKDTEPPKEILSPGTVGLSLEYDLIPEVSEEKSSFKAMVVSFKDMDTKIKINNEEVEFMGLEKAAIEINNFQGALSFDETSISLNGKGNRLALNGMVISTKKDMEISFDGLVYEQLALGEVKIGSILFEGGSGKITVDQKLTYVLDYNENIELIGFLGNYDMGSEDQNQSAVTLTGKVSGLSVDGEHSLKLG